MDLPSTASATIAAERSSLWPRVIDRLEQAAIILLWVFLVRRMVDADNPLAILVLVAETSIVVLNTIRRSTDDISVNPSDWVLAATATGVVMLVQPEPTPWPALVPIGVLLVTFGNLLQLSAKLFLLRSFGIAPANRGVKVNGIYKIVRHPMYAGYLITHIGVMVLMPSMLNFFIYFIGWTAQILRLLAEERLLGEDPSYREYMARVRWRLIPGIY